MKFLIRRVVVGIIAIPVVAGTYLALYTFLVLAGADPGMSFGETFNNGMFIGVTASVFLIFYPQISRFLDRVID